MSHALAAIWISRGRAIAILGVSMLLIATLALPAGAHDGGTSHLWTGHIKPMGDAGTINDAANPVHWTKLKGVPAGLADGVDNNTPVVGFGLKYAGFGILTINADQTQRRVTGSCPAGQAVRSVGQTGGVVCTEGPTAVDVTDADTGIICNGEFCTEGTLALAEGTWSITAKIRVSQQGDDDRIRVTCRLSAGGQTDQALIYLPAVVTFAGDAVLPMQLLATMSAPGNATVTCRDFDVGNVFGRDLSIIAVRVSD